MESKSEKIKIGKRLKFTLSLFLITGSLYFIFVGLTSGKGFFIPLFTAMILAMVMNPVAMKLKKWGVNKALSVLISDLIIVAFIGFLIFLLAAQANRVADNWPEVEKRLEPKIEKAQNFFNKKLNMQDFSGATQKESSQTEMSSAKESNSNQSLYSSFNLENVRNKLTGIVKDIFSFLSDLLLILVYVFFFMFYKEKFENAIVGMVHEDKQEKTRKILHKIATTSQQYLFGRFMLIIILAALYLTGFSIIGLKYAIFISLIASIFSLIPYVGNLVGLLLAFTMSVMTGGGSGEMIGIAVVFSVSQFVESYLLEPFIVGGKVDVNPVIIIVGVVLGGLIWGIMGMLLSIPILGILRVVFNNVESLRPLGYVLDERDVSSGEGKGKKAKEWFKKKLKK